MDLLSLYLVFLRALYNLHQNNHWEAEDYGHHLLFQRIYESVKEMVDEAAEKIVGLFGKITKQDKISSNQPVSLMLRNMREQKSRKD
ncbi:MAG: hypothetical protein HC877_23935 [Thioploca sp.]|nr:hypothetical protein [Thioploca sp.]